MSGLWRLVAEREVRTRLRDKGFRISTAFTLVLVVGLLALSAYLGSRSDQYDVAVGPQVPAAVTGTAERLLRADSDSARIDLRSRGAYEVRSLVKDGDVDAGVLLGEDGFVLLGDDDLDPALRSALTGAVADTVVRANADRDGVDLDRLRAGSTPTVELLDPHAQQASERSGVAFVFAIVFFLTALTFGMAIATSVVQEKESRVVEILAAAVPIRTLLWGKVAGNTVLAVGQVALLATVGLVGLLATGQRELLGGVGWSIVGYLGFFLLGFLALASLWSVAGSVATRQEDLASTTLPMQLILMVPYLTAVLGGDQLRTVVSMVPVVSTMIMPGRIAEGSVPVWQVAVALAGTAATAVLLVRLGAHIYERTLLRTDRRVTLREAVTADAP